MITGHLQIKNGYWYAVLNLRDETGKQKPKWFATHLPEKGNKKRAEEILTELRIKHTGLEDMRRNSRGIYFNEYMTNWVSNMQGKVSPKRTATTRSSYKTAYAYTFGNTEFYSTI